MSGATRSDDLAAKVQYLIDKDEIEQLLATYCRALDRHDAELLRSVYHADATEKHGAFDGPVSDFIDNYVAALWEIIDVGFHAMAHNTIKVDGTTATGESYVLVATQSEESEGSGADRIMAARYLDRFERRDGGPWLIAARTVVFDWVGVWNYEKLPPFPMPDGYLRGTVGRDDLSYDYV